MRYKVNFGTCILTLKSNNHREGETPPTKPRKIMRYIIIRIKEDGTRDYLYRVFPRTTFIEEKRLALRLHGDAVLVKSFHLNSIGVNHIIEEILDN